MVDTMHSETAPPRTESEGQDGHVAESAPDISSKIRQSQANSETESSYFFRGFAIFLAIAAVFWIVVIGLFHLF